MTSDEIKKALECCSNSNTSDSYCVGCPYDKIKYCAAEQSKDTLTYIIELETEIEMLQKQHEEDNKLLNDRIKEAVNTTDKANQKYIDRLEKRIEDYKHLDVILNTAIDKLAKNIKSEALKEFAERLKEAKANSTMDSRICSTEMIDDLVKEMIGENNGI